MRMWSSSITVAFMWAIAVPASRWSYVDATSTVTCTDSCIIVAASLAGEGAGLADISRTCKGVCAAVEAQSGTSCSKALLGSPPEHLVLLAYSSGHGLESAAILLGAALNASEDAAFITSLHLNDRGSPVGCSDIDDAHYCLGQVSLVASLGLCLPTGCDSASVLALVGNLTSMLSNDTSSSSSSGSSFAAAIGEASFTCGNELRLGIDAGTVTVFCLISALVALAVVGTSSDYFRRQSRRHDNPENIQKKRQVIVTEESRVVPVPMTPSAGTGSEAPLPPTSSHVEEAQNIGVQLDREDIEISKFSGDASREPLLPSEPLTAEAGQQPSFLSDRVESEGNDDEGSRPLHNHRVDGRVEWWVECLECFSLIKNTDKLLAPLRPGDEFPPALEGVRALSILWVLLGHTVLYALKYGAGYTNVNDILPQDGSGFLARLTAQVIPGAFLSVDTFFLMSGFLVSCVLLPKLDTMPPGRYLWIAQAYLHRYLRLTPTLAFVVLMTWKILPLFGEGPTWWPAMITRKDSCSKYWWTEVTYLSNVIPWPPRSDGCIDVSWYLANDTQFFVVAVLLVALFHRRPRAGTVVALLTLAASCLHTLLWFGFHKDVRLSFLTKSDDWNEAYSEPWSRCPPYLIGLLCGFLWRTKVRGRFSGAKNEDSTSDRDYSSTPRERFMTTKVAASVAVASAALLAVPVYGSYWAYQDIVESQMPAWADHLYLAFSRPAWALGVAGMCALCFTGRGGMVNWILTWPAWVILSRLTYCAYLSHPLLLTWLYGMRLTSVEFTSLEYAVTFMGCVIGTFAGAIVLHLLVEAPFINLESLRRKDGGAEDSM